MIAEPPKSGTLYFLAVEMSCVQLDMKCNLLCKSFSPLSNMRSILFFILTSALFSFTACNTAATPAPPSSNFDVDNELRDYYYSKGGHTILGAVISLPIIDNGLKVQYFQNVRLEYHPNLPFDRRVVPSPLGLMFSDVEPCIMPEKVSPQASYFGCHSVREEILIFFNKYGGIQFFGYPLSELSIAEGQRFIQKFERAFIIWDKSKPIGSRFGLANLGQRACEAKCPPLSGSTLPSFQQTQIAPQSTTTESSKDLAGKIKIRSELEYPVFPVKTHEQTLKIWVRDTKTGTPLPNINIVVVIQIPGRSLTYIPSLTDAFGYTSLSFTLEPTLKSGEVIYYTIKVVSDEITLSSSGSFLAWNSP
jgi:hypothetical protein